jgi:hypothetical protein
MMVAALMLLSFAVGMMLMSSLDQRIVSKAVATADRANSEAQASIVMAENAVRLAREAIETVDSTEPEEIETKTKVSVKINQFMTSGRYN